MGDPPLADRAFSHEPRLVVERGPVAVTQLALDKTQLDVGRSSKNDLVINDPEISRRHARIVFHDDRYAVEDLDSTNGTYVNGIRTKGPTPLKHGDRIEFGDAATVRIFLHEDVFAADRVQGWAQEGTQGELAPWRYAGDDELPPAADRRRWLWGCAALILVLCLCGTATLFVLDAYDQGRLLYCGGLRPFWEVFLGPFGFNPLCP